MGCECIPPPPIFDLPPPPDPTLIWHLISDEPESALRKVRLQTCEFNPIYEFIGLEGTLQGLILFGVSCFLTVLFTVCTVTICYQKLCRRKCPKRSPSSSGDTSSKFNSSSDTIVTNGVTPSQWNPRSPQFVTIGMPQYGSASVNNIASNNTLLILSQPVMGLQSSTTMMRIPKPQQPRSFAVRQPIDQTSAYCTLNRHYEEIPVNYAMPPSNSGTTSTIPTSFSHNFNRGPSQRRFIEQQQQPTQAMLFLDRLAAAQNNIERKPPPTCRPPPPPSDSTNRSSASTDELDGSSVDAEIEVINRQQHCSPINSRQSEFGGRESGYGTGPSRLWNHQSPRAPPRTIMKDSSSPPSTTSTSASPPSLKTAVCGNSNNNDSQKPMTYV